MIAKLFVLQKKLQNQLFSCVDVYCKIGEYFWKKDTFYIMLCYVRAHVLSLMNLLPICTCSIYRCSLPHSINLVQQTICDTIYGHNVDICVVLIETIGRNANIALYFDNYFFFNINIHELYTVYAKNTLAFSLCLCFLDFHTWLQKSCQ